LSTSFVQKLAKFATDSIANYLTGLGTKADPATTARPRLDKLPLTNPELSALYTTDDLARRIVEELVDDALRGGYQLRHRATSEPLELPRELGADAAVWQGAVWGRLYGRGAILLVPAEDVDLSEPRPEGVKLANLLPLGGDELRAASWEGDVRNPNYGRPSSYSVNPTSPATLVGGYGFSALREVHASWLLMFGGDPLPPEMRGFTDGADASVLQVVWEALRRFLQTEQAIANIVLRFETATISIAGLASVLASEEGSRLIQQRMQLFSQSLSMLNAALIDADSGEKYERSYAQVRGFEAIWDRMALSVSKAAGIPMTQLFGQSPGGLGSDDKSGRANWRKRVASYQDKQIAPVLRALAAAVGHDDVVITFDPLDEVTPEQKQVMDESLARLLTQATGSGWMTLAEARELARRRGWPLPEENDEAVTAGQLASAAAVAQLPETEGGGVAALVAAEKGPGSAPASE
jgi:phage-related protein (TIGR01555 family)